ncbi:hypothetical protein OOK31_09785 [Streptomyces sp. NBC_00249]|uniref:hypothetical protein n=1 Tax=Streptomyces sp. NBC_00249 TaxID=2975690 RepID=UPI00224EE82E|nr:hypothetical protein [Streptomyces sp. NBC_00249]MCX5194182.1 hypothetical protein [Streptomyces sp. NBC_00249]
MARVRVGRRGPVAALAALLAPAALLAGCATDPVRIAPADTLARRKQVAEAWEGSEALHQWRSGYHPLDPQDWQPPGGFRSGEDKAAYLSGNFTLRAELPSAAPPATPVRWSGGGELTLRLMGAREAYEEFAMAPGQERPLTVTAVRFGAATTRTSRGPAEVPAWLFTVEGYDTPLTRLAIRPQELPTAPVAPKGTFDEGTAPLFAHTAAAPGATSFEVTAGHGACDAGVAVDVLEGAATVVLAGRILPREDVRPDAACPLVMLEQTVPVTLTRPLGDRLLLDATTGTPLQPRNTRR